MSRFTALLLLVLALVAVAAVLFDDGLRIHAAALGRYTLATAIVLVPILAVGGLVGHIAKGGAVAAGGRPASDDPSARAAAR